MAHLIPVGNSFGVRIPKAIITQMGFQKDSDLVFKVTDEGLLISNKRKSREGWEEAFKKSRKNKRKQLLMGEINNKFDESEWEW